MQTGTTFDSIAWGAVFLDADNDTNLDLYVSGMLDGSDPDKLPSAFYHNQNDGTFIIPENIGFENDTKSSFGNAIGDINNDGLADIIVMNNSNENYFLWENQTTTSNNWIKIKLKGIASNKDGIGNKIEIFANGLSQFRYTLCGEGYLGQNSSSEFIGLGNANLIDYIKVTWNASGLVETITNVLPNQGITIEEGNGILNTNNIKDFTTYNIFPNPSHNGWFYISSLTENRFKYSITNLLGERLFIHNNTVNGNTSINLSTYPPGLYFLKITTYLNITKTFKLIKG